MSRWWKGMALAAWLGLGVTARAQQFIPTPVGAARMPEPAPCGAPAPPPLVPGPISPLMAPPGPGPELSLPCNHSSAFQCEQYAMERACYASLGMQWLQREQLGRGAVAVFSPTNLDTGVNPPRRSPVALAYDDLTPGMEPGIRGTIGYLANDRAIELSGFYVFQVEENALATRPGQIDVFFTNPPLGFEGNNGLFRQADGVLLKLRSEFGNAELNYRRWNVGIAGAELLLGVRYVHHREVLDILTDDDGLVFRDPDNNPDPRRRATFTSEVRNNIVAPQIGMEYNTQLPGHLLSCVWLGVSGKAAVGPNFVRFRQDLVRGDDFRGFGTSSTTTVLSQIYDIGAFVDIHLLERCRLRAGYNAIWLVDVATSNGQINFDLASPGSARQRNDSILYHGPSFELQFLF